VPAHDLGGVTKPPTPWIGSASMPAIRPVVVVWISSSRSFAHATPQLERSSLNGQR